MTDATVTILDCSTGPQRDQAVKQAADVLRRGGLVGFPTETVYGVAAAVDNADGMARLRELKHRPADKPFSVHLPDPPAIERYVDPSTQPVLTRLIRKTWPGPVTYVVQVEPEVIREKLRELGLDENDQSLLYHENTIGLRCPDDAVASAFLSQAPGPVVASSANRNGQPEPHDARQAAQALDGAAEVILDGGTCRFSQPSTVARVAGDQLEVLREGVFDSRYLEKLLTRNILFVCSGNTCRSPMAEAIARQKLADRLKIKPSQLEDRRWTVGSAGAFAMSGAPATDYAVRAVRDMGIDPPKHSSRALTPSLIHQAERVYCMTQTHLHAVMMLAPEAMDKVQLLDDRGELSDPMGGSIDVYRQTARQIADAIDKRLDQLIR